MAFLVVHAQDDHADRAIGAQQLTGCRQPVDDGHIDVHQDDVGVLFEADPLHLESVAGFANDGDPALQFQEGLEALTEQLMVVSEYDADIVGGAARRLSVLVEHRGQSSVVNAVRPGRWCGVGLLWPFRVNRPRTAQGKSITMA